MTLTRIAMLTVHTSPLAPMGGKKTGGMNVYIRELAQELGRRGLLVDIFTRRTSPDEPDIDLSLGMGVRVIYLTAGPVALVEPDDLVPYLSPFTVRLMSFATLQNIVYDLIYSHYWLSGWVAHKLKEAWGVPFVQMFHTLGQMKERIQTVHTAALDNQRIHIEMDVVAWADRVIAATPAEQSQLLWLYRAKPRRITIVPPGVNLSRFHPVAREEARRSLGFEKCHLLLFVGRIEPLKSVDTILEALAIVRRDAPHTYANLCFAIIGGNPRVKDPDIDTLKALVSQLELGDTVTFVGAKDQEQLPLYYSAATAVLMPSEYESFGMVALEAMASGTPVIATNVGGLAHVVRDSVTGYHVPVRDPQRLAARILDILENTALRDQLSTNAARVAQDYGWDHIADQLLVIFNSLIAPRRRRAQ